MWIKVCFRHTAAENFKEFYSAVVPAELGAHRTRLKYDTFVGLGPEDLDDEEIVVYVRRKENALECAVLYPEDPLREESFSLVGSEQSEYDCYTELVEREPTFRGGGIEAFAQDLNRCM